MRNEPNAADARKLATARRWLERVAQSLESGGHCPLIIISTAVSEAQGGNVAMVYANGLNYATIHDLLREVMDYHSPNTTITGESFEHLVNELRNGAE